MALTVSKEDKEETKLPQKVRDIWKSDEVSIQITFNASNPETPNIDLSWVFEKN